MVDHKTKYKWVKKVLKRIKLCQSICTSKTNLIKKVIYNKNKFKSKENLYVLYQCLMMDHNFLYVFFISSLMYKSTTSNYHFPLCL